MSELKGYSCCTRNASSRTWAAQAAKVYAQRQKLGDEAIGYAHAIRVEALRRLGEILKANPERNRGGGEPGVGRKGRKNAVHVVNSIPTLAEVGIDRHTSSLAQTLADMPPDQFASVHAGVESMAKAIHVVRTKKRQKERCEKIATTSGKNAPLSAPKRYPVLYVDPPWRYEHAVSDSRAVENQYPTMTTKEICALPVARPQNAPRCP